MTDTNNTNEVKLTNAEIRAEMVRLQAANTLLLEQLALAKKASESRITIKVSAKGAVSVYGLGRWPITLYRTQWERLIGVTKDITTFIALHESELAVKGDATDATAAPTSPTVAASEPTKRTISVPNGASVGYSTKNGPVK